MEMGQAMMFSHNTHKKGLCEYSKNSVIGKYEFKNLNIKKNKRKMVID